MVSDVHRPKDSWQACDVLARQAWSKDFFIEHPALAQIIKDFNEKLIECERSRKATGMFIEGGSGSGKTTLVNRLKTLGEQRYARHDEERTICPVLSLAVPDPCTPFEFSVAILKALGDADPRGRKNKLATHHAAECFLTQCEVRLILIDNVQDIPARRATRGVELVSTRLRQFFDSSFAVWVFLGTEAAKQVINSDPQIVKRVGYRAKLDYFSIQTRAEMRLFSRILEKLDAALPLSQPSCLIDPKNRPRIFLATEGIFDRLVQLVERGWYLAFSERREVMTLTDLESAFTYVHGPCTSAKNPFSQEFAWRQLHGVNEPFEILKGVHLADTTAA